MSGQNHPTRRSVGAGARRLSEMESVIGAMPDAVFIYDHTGLLAHANEAGRALLGLDITSPDDVPLTARERVSRVKMLARDGSPIPERDWIIERLLRGEAILADAAVEVSLTTSNGAQSLFSFTGAPIRDTQGEIVGAVSVGRDVTERLRLERDLRDTNLKLQVASAALSTHANNLELSNRRMDQFLGIANHEMKTPLTSLSVYLQLAMRRLKRMARTADRETPATERANRDADEMMSLLTRAQGSLRRITRMVNELLDVSRIQSGRLEARLELCDLASLAQTVVAEQRRGYPGRSIVLDVTCDHAPVMADPDRMSEVIENFLSNAIKYSPATAPVAVTLAALDDTTVRLAVRDEGRGIAPETQARVWDVFERLDATSSQSNGDTNLGLGLHICKTILELHGGKIGIESALGAGSTFWFTLPLVGGPAE